MHVPIPQYTTAPSPNILQRIGAHVYYRNHTVLCRLLPYIQILPETIISSLTRARTVHTELTTLYDATHDGSVPACYSCIHQTAVYHTSDIYTHTLLTTMYRAAHFYMLHSQTACYPKTISLRRRVAPVNKGAHHGSLHDQWHGLTSSKGPYLVLPNRDTTPVTLMGHYLTWRPNLPYPACSSHCLI